MAQRTTHELDESESRSPPLERPSKLVQKPDYNSDWNSRKKALRDQPTNASVLNPSRNNLEEMEGDQKQNVLLSDKK